ncbi:MAG TPA: hypothetical protein VMU94_20160 [Streptosporangiaceae bacterium]|nr:hypothetical protein [Streptosporangiaceae bacterium]
MPADRNIRAIIRPAASLTGTVRLNRSRLASHPSHCRSSTAFLDAFGLTMTTQWPLTKDEIAALIRDDEWWERRG